MYKLILPCYLTSVRCQEQNFAYSIGKLLFLAKSIDVYRTCLLIGLNARLLNVENSVKVIFPLHHTSFGSELRANKTVNKLTVLRRILTVFIEIIKLSTV